MPNLFKVSGVLYRGAQPDKAGMQELQKLGVKTVVSLRTFSNLRYAIGEPSDENLIKGTSLAFRPIPFKIWHPETEDMIKFLKIVTSPGQQPVFVHCHRGIDRTGTMVVLYRIAVEGWSKEQAIDEMIHGGFGYDDLFPNLITFIHGLNINDIKRGAGL